MEQARQQLAPSKITGRPEQDHHLRIPRTNTWRNFSHRARSLIIEWRARQWARISARRRATPLPSSDVGYTLLDLALAVPPGAHSRPLNCLPNSVAAGRSLTAVLGRGQLPHADHAVKALPVSNYLPEVLANIQVRR